MLILAGIDDPNLIALPPILLPRLTACLAVSSVIPVTLRRRLWVVWFYTASVPMLRLLLLSLSVGRQSVSATVTAASEPSVSTVVSVTAITTSVTAPLSATAKTRKTGFGRSL